MNPLVRIRALAIAFTRPAALTLFFYGFSSGLPFLLVGGTLSGWLKQSHVSLDAIGLASYLGLSYSFKFVWSPAVDRLRLPLLDRLGQRRSWLLLAQCVLALALLGMAAVPPEKHFALFLAFVGLAAFAGATQDTAIDAYRIEIAPPEMQGALASTYVFGYRLALIASGAVALILAQKIGWADAYRAMAAMLLVPIAAVLLAREPAEHRARARNLREALQDSVVGPFQQFFARYPARLALLLVAFILLFQVSGQMLAPMALPFYLASGFDLSQIAEVSKIYGVVVTLLGAFAGGAVVLRWGAERSMPWALAAAAASNLLFPLMGLHPGSLPVFALVILSDNFSTGLLGTVAIAFLSDLTDHRYTATQYALLSSLTVLGGRLLAGVSGFMVTALGYTGFFVLTAAAGLPALLLWFAVRPALLHHQAATRPPAAD